MAAVRALPIPTSTLATCVSFKRSRNTTWPPSSTTTMTTDAPRLTASAYAAPPTRLAASSVNTGFDGSSARTAAGSIDAKASAATIAVNLLVLMTLLSSMPFGVVAMTGGYTCNDRGQQAGTADVLCGVRGLAEAEGEGGSGMLIGSPHCLHGSTGRSDKRQRVNRRAQRETSARRRPRAHAARHQQRRRAQSDPRRAVPGDRHRAATGDPVRSQHDLSVRRGTEGLEAGQCRERRALGSLRPGLRAGPRQQPRRLDVPAPAAVLQTRSGQGTQVSRRGGAVPRRLQVADRGAPDRSRQEHRHVEPWQPAAYGIRRARGRATAGSREPARAGDREHARVRGDWTAQGAARTGKHLLARGDPRRA